MKRGTSMISGLRATRFVGSDHSRVFDLGSAASTPLLLKERIGTAPLERPGANLTPFRSLFVESGALQSRAIGVAGTNATDGSGAVAAGLALAAASTGMTVTLVSSHTENIVGLSSEELAAGLHAALVLRKDISEITLPIESCAGAVDYLPPGPLGNDDLLSHHRGFITLLDQLTSEVVIVELPPILGDVHAALISRSLDLVLVCTTGKRARQNADAATTRLKGSGVNDVMRVHLASPAPRPLLTSARALGEDNQMHVETKERQRPKW